MYPLNSSMNTSRGSTGLDSSFNGTVEKVYGAPPTPERTYASTSAPHTLERVHSVGPQTPERVYVSSTETHNRVFRNQDNQIFTSTPSKFPSLDMSKYSQGYHTSSFSSEMLNGGSTSVSSTDQKVYKSVQSFNTVTSRSYKISED